MYTQPVGTKINAASIKAAIKHNEGLESRYNKLERYYRGKHDILNRVKPKTSLLANNKSVTNHAKYITDMQTGYLLGSPVDYKVTEGYNIDPVKEAYKKQRIGKLDQEIAKDLSIFGVQYEYIFAMENQLYSKDIDVRNCIVVYDDTMLHKPMFAVIYYRNEKFKINQVLAIDTTDIYEFTATNQAGEILYNTKSKTPHVFGRVPVIEYVNNSERMGDYEQVIPLIDAYNILQSDRVNDKEQLVAALLLIYGFDLDDDEAETAKETRIISNLPIEAKAEYLTKQLSEDQLEVLRKSIENDIHKIAMTPNMSDENFVGNSSGVAIRYKLLAFIQSVSNKELYFEDGLLQRFECYANWLTVRSAMKEVPIYEVDAVFKRNLPQNDYETSQMIANLSGKVDDETLVGELSFVKDAKATIEKAKKEALERANAVSEAFGTGQPNTGEGDDSDEDAENE